MLGRNILKEEEAVSPIIGTILMVAITVIMAAIISSWSASIKAPEAPISVGLDISRQNITQVRVTVTSIEPPNTEITGINFSDTTTADTYNFADPANNTGFIYKNQVFGGTIGVGSTRSFNVSDFNKFVVIMVKYADGTEKTVYSQNI